MPKGFAPPGLTCRSSMQRVIRRGRTEAVEGTWIGLGFGFEGMDRHETAPPSKRLVNVYPVFRCHKLCRLPCV